MSANGNETQIDCHIAYCGGEKMRPCKVTNSHTCIPCSLITHYFTFGAVVFFLVFKKCTTYSLRWNHNRFTLYILTYIWAIWIVSPKAIKGLLLMLRKHRDYHRWCSLRWWWRLIIIHHFTKVSHHFCLEIYAYMIRLDCLAYLLYHVMVGFCSDCVPAA